MSKIAKYLIIYSYKEEHAFNILHFHIIYFFCVSQHRPNGQLNMGNIEQEILEFIFLICHLRNVEHFFFDRPNKSSCSKNYTIRFARIQNFNEPRRLILRIQTLDLIIAPGTPKKLSWGIEFHKKKRLELIQKAGDLGLNLEFQSIFLKGLE